MAKIKSPSKNAKRYQRYKPRGLTHHAFDRVYWPYIPLLVLAGLLLGLGLKSGSLDRGLHRPGGHVLAYAESDDSTKLLSDTNARRLAAGDGALQLNAALSAAAQAKAQDIVSKDYWSHYTPDGQPPSSFVSAQHYAYQKLGENLAAGFKDEYSTVSAWMASPEHRQNLLDPAFTQVGFGSANVADFKAAGGGPMTITVAFYGAPATSNGQVLGGTQASGSSSLSLAQLALAGLPFNGYITLLAVALAASSFGYWISRHLKLIRRALGRSEKIIADHPLLDMSLLVIAGLAYILSQTAGLIH